MADLIQDAPPTFETLRLEFGHDCRYVGCNLQGCSLCRNNPNRRCTSHFREKYIDNVNRYFNAQCDAPIMITLADSVTGQEYFRTEEDQDRLLDLQYMLCLLEGPSYDQRESEVGTLNVSHDDLEGMMMLDNNTTTPAVPLLVPAKNAPGEHTPDHRLLVPLKDGGTPVLCRTTRSSQSTQGGRVRPFRMLARAVYPDGSPVPWIQHAVSDPFVVTTRRTQAAEKAMVPKEDDPVNKLPGVGKETHTKLKNLAAAGIEYPLANYQIFKVKDLFNLMDTADHELLSELGRVLGLTAAKVQDLQRNVRLMARVDSRRRVWNHPEVSGVRLLYPCNAGAPLLRSTEIEVVLENEDNSVGIYSTADLTGAVKELVEGERLRAEALWWDEGHPGWGIWNEQDEEEQGQPLPQEPVPVETYRPQLDRQCKARHGNYAELDSGYNQPADSSQYGSSQGYGQAKPEASFGSMCPPAQPAYSSGLSEGYSGQPQQQQEKEHHYIKPYEFAVQAQDGLCKAPESVFSDGARVESDMVTNASMDTFSDTNATNLSQPRGSLHLYNAHSAQRQLSAQDTGAAPNFYNFNSSDILLEEPAGLAGFAYITNGNGAETSGRFRFKRSVSGTRYKPTDTGHYQPQMPTIDDDQSAPPELRQDLHPTFTAELPELPENFHTLASLPSHRSWELRTLSSLDRMKLDPVASWQQNRLSSAASHGRYKDFLHGLSLSSSSIENVLSNLEQYHSGPYLPQQEPGQTRFQAVHPGTQYQSAPAPQHPGHTEPPPGPVI